MKNNNQIPDKQTLLDNLDQISQTLDKTYLSHLNSSGFQVLPFDEFNGISSSRVNYTDNIRALRIVRWVYDKDEKIADCFKNVMSVFAGSESSLSLAIHRKSNNVAMYFVLKNNGLGENEKSRNDIELLADSLRGNFPGTELSILNSKDGDVQTVFDFEQFRSVAALCNIPSEKSEDFISQGIDKLINGIVPKSDDDGYWIVILAESLSQASLRQIIGGYQELATAIAPFAGYQFQSGKSETATKGEMESLSNSEGVSQSIAKTHSVSISVKIPRVNIAAQGGYSRSKIDTESSIETETTGSNSSISMGESENTTYTYKSYLVTDLIEKLEATIKRLNESQSTGLWKCASYVFSSNAKMSKNIANYLRALTQGEQSYIEPSFVQEWSKLEGNGLDTFTEIRNYVQHFCHPIFTSDKGISVTPTMNASTTELSNVFAFPRYSMQGIPVVECARFGREPHSLTRLEGDVNVGCAYHMHTQETKSRICLGRNDLTAHTFITGSTGSGKSNTVYTLLDKLCLSSEEKAHFLVIEPAKGEYKDALGGYNGVSVYGTNPQKTELLRLNPFAFPDDIHVLEHIDRLVEIFNACWPMYAAMPAVLKDAVEQAYVKAGWSLTLSECSSGRFPTFRDVIETLPEVVSGNFSQDTQGDYKGALETRLRSLTNGINGQILCSAFEIKAEDLFDKNVIVDLSRVGSSETKALLMGVLILKLQEHRMTQRTKGMNKPNSGLEHLTVLEEAHNLLRRTSSEQTQESSNLQGKSVEMLTNAIAEMRSYGEGFIIADQSPGLLDMAVIRNTNTKIIMRLPDQSDRELVGNAAGLNDDQIVELSKLETGVAAVYQNEWLEPVLCKVDEFGPGKKMGYTYSPLDYTNDNFYPEMFNLLCGREKFDELNEEQVDRFNRWIDRINVRDELKALLKDMIQKREQVEKSRTVLYRLVRGEKLFNTPKIEISEIERMLSEEYQLTDLELVRQIREQLINLEFEMHPKRKEAYTDAERRHQNG